MICIFSCPSCGDRMVYSLEKKCLVCPTCGNECEADTYDTSYMIYEGMVEKSDEIELLSCPACGAKLSIKEGSAKLNCSYCDSELTAFGVHENELSPEYIIPNQLSEDDAKRKLFTWWANHDSLPKYDEKKLKITFQDIYVPVWLINADSVCAIKASYIPYDPLGNLPEETISKVYGASFIHVPFDASCHIVDDKFHNIEPFSFNEMIPFNPSYLSGHLAECYHFDANQTLATANKRLQNFAFKQCMENIDVCIGGGNVDNFIEKSIDITPTEIKYALVPVWVCTYQYAGQKLNVYINGQTGKTEGDVIIQSSSTKANIVIYGITALLMLTSVSFLCYALFSLKLFVLASPIAVTYFALILSNAIEKLIYHKNSKNYFATVSYNENIQLRQGLKFSPLLGPFINIMLFIITLFINYSITLPFLRYADLSWILFPTLISVIGTVIMIAGYIDKIRRYQSFVKKADYYDYVRAGSMYEIEA